MEKDEIFSIINKTRGVKPVPVDVPDWGKVFLLPLTVGQIESRIGKDQEDDKYVLSRSIARSLCDKNGKLVLDADNEEHLQMIADQPWERLDSIRKAMDSINSPKA